MKGGRGEGCRIRREGGGGRGEGGGGGAEVSVGMGRRVQALGQRLRAIGCLLSPQLGKGLLMFFGYCFSYDRFELFCR